MRTTVDIPDLKYRVLKSKAASEGTTVKELVLRGVDAVLAPEVERSRRRFETPPVNSGTPGSLKIDNERIYDLIGFP